MNREIKFRAWDKESKVMCGLFNDSYPWSIDHTVLTLDIAHVHEDSDIDDFILMQFTGLLDIKGFEIYEGDILSIGLSGQDEKWNSQKVVEWDKKWSGFGPLCYLNYHGDSDRYCTVIGNIYESPELLK
jgi:uncharacterized phage protein (TIGR01671 family)